MVLRPRVAARRIDPRRSHRRQPPLLDLDSLGDTASSVHPDAKPVAEACLARSVSTVLAIIGRVRRRARTGRDGRALALLLSLPAAGGVGQLVLCTAVTIPVVTPIWHGCLRSGFRKCRVLRSVPEFADRSSDRTTLRLEFPGGRVPPARLRACGITWTMRPPFLPTCRAAIHTATPSTLTCSALIASVTERSVRSESRPVITPRLLLRRCVSGATPRSNAATPEPGSCDHEYDRQAERSRGSVAQRSVKSLRQQAESVGFSMLALTVEQGVSSSSTIEA